MTTYTGSLPDESDPVSVGTSRPVESEGPSLPSVASSLKRNSAKSSSQTQTKSDFRDLVIKRKKPFEIFSKEETRTFRRCEITMCRARCPAETQPFDDEFLDLAHHEHGSHLVTNRPNWRRGR